MALGARRGREDSLAGGVQVGVVRVATEVGGVQEVEMVMRVEIVTALGGGDAPTMPGASGRGMLSAWHRLPTQLFSRLRRSTRIAAVKVLLM